MATQACDSTDSGDPESLNRLERALAATPHDASLHRAMASARHEHGDELGSLAHQVAAQTLESRAAPIELCKVATGYFMKGDHSVAERWYRLVLSLDPDTAVAHQNLAAIHAARGDAAQADCSRRRAYAIQRVFVEDVDAPLRRLLILCAGRGSGNVPFETLLSRGRSTRIKYVIDFTDEREDACLPDFDLVFNAVGEPDAAMALAARLERFASRCRYPLLNAPASVARTARHRLAALLEDLDDAVVATCSRYEDVPASQAELDDRLRRDGLSMPILARPLASHGGQGLVRSDTLGKLFKSVCEIGGAHYLTTCHDVRSADGFFRKYRVVFVDRQAFAYHLAISSHWMVHYFSADMAAHPWRLEEESGFLSDPRHAIGARAWAVIEAIASRMDLDYAGIDFALLPDGRVFVFEANATMLVHRERANGPLAYRNVHVERIVDAFERLQTRRTASDSA